MVQAVLIFGSDMWVLTPRMGHALGSFQQGVVRHITGRQTSKLKEGGWETHRWRQRWRRRDLRRSGIIS